MDHLRPHPTEVVERDNIKKKMELRKSDKYHYAFNPDDYTDIEFFNVLGRSTKVYSGLRYALRYVQKPILFFTGYDVGQNDKLGVFVRHVVCSLAVHEGTHINIYFFDMRDLQDISPSMQRHMESEFEKHAGVPVHLINSACVDRTKCVYLQRFKGEYEMGWCIAWAMFFLMYLTKNARILSLSPPDKKKAIAKLYTDINRRLSAPKSNKFIEKFYMHLMGLSVLGQ
jgi:hypothetical protein